MSTLKLISLFLMASLYIFAGISHFRKPKFFLSITPPWVPAPEKVNIIVGIIEIVLGVGLLFLVRSILRCAWNHCIIDCRLPSECLSLSKSKKEAKTRDGYFDSNAYPAIINLLGL